MPRGSNSSRRILTVCLASAMGFGVIANARAQESWDAIYLAGAHVGFVHTSVEKVKNKGRDYLRVRVDIEQSFKRGRDVASTRLTYGTIESPDGQVLRLDTFTDTGQQRIRAHGDVIDGQMNLIVETPGGNQEQVVPWGPDIRGPYAAEQSMARAPMKPHDTRTLKQFIPTLNKVAEITLEALGLENTVMGDGTPRNLLHIEQKTRIDGKVKPEFDLRIWVDPEGQVLKQEQDILGGYVQFRTTKQAAKAKGGEIQFDLITGSLIKLKHVIPNAEKSSMVRYKLTMKDGQPGEIIPTDSRQTLQPGENKSEAILTVQSRGPLDGDAGPPEVDQQYLKSNALVTADDRQVRALAIKATRGADDPWEKAKRIQHWVHVNVREKNFATAFAAANEVARNLSGDCTEHSVLAAAMCRAVAIPSRVAIGLVYVQKESALGYHMWAEVYVNQRWVAIDPTWDQWSVDATHIKISDSSLEGVAPFEAFTPIIRVMGKKLEIDPIEFR
jgi:Transglutaminase-like superfamily